MVICVVQVNRKQTIYPCAIFCIRKPMPEAAKRPCRKPSCPALTHATYCDAHAPEARRQREQWKGSAASRGYDAAWQRVRLRILKRDNYLCIPCLKRGRITPAEAVDHIVPIRVAPDRRLDETNCQAIGVVCGCHHQKTMEDQAKFPSLELVKKVR